MNSILSIVFLFLHFQLSRYPSTVLPFLTSTTSARAVPASPVWMRPPCSVISRMIVPTATTRKKIYVVSHPSKFFSVLQSYCFRLSVVFLSYDSRSTLIRLDRRKEFGRATQHSSYVYDSWSPLCNNVHAWIGTASNEPYFPQPHEQT